MTKTYFFKRMVGPTDWNALRRVHQAGEMVEKFVGHTYGLDREDAIYLNRETIPCSDGNGGFFTVPVEMLEDENGKSPVGGYTVSRPQSGGAT